jgi:nucleoid-associated protein YgaU
MEEIEAAIEDIAAADETEMGGHLQSILARTPADQETKVGAEAPAPLEKDVGVERRTRSGERLDQIAYRYYRNPAMWRLLAIANGLDDPFDLSPDRPLRIPPEPSLSQGVL